MNTIQGRVLVVDDEADIRQVCARALGGIGLSVGTAAGAQEALELMKEGEWDCVLTDLAMPGSLNGSALVEEVKRRYPAVDVVIMTGTPTVETAVSTLKHGACEYLTKPFALMTLQAAVTRCLEKRRLSPELDREKLLVQELSAAYAELQKADDMKNAFTSILSHELRTPLTSAISAAEMIGTGSSNPGLEEKVLGILRSSLAREKEAVEELLLFASLASGNVKARSVAVDLEEVIRALVENYRSIWEEKELSVTVSFAGAGKAFRGDPALLQNAFKHLLLNAINFNRRGGRVEISAEDRADGLHILFADTGIGIPPEKQGSIFDRFYQVADHMTREVGGLGLGLAIVRKALEAQGGFISVDSRPEVGSVFRATFPSRSEESLKRAA